MEWTVDKFYVRFPEKGQNYSEPEVISAVHGVRDNMYFEDGNWMLRDKKDIRTIEQISPDDERTRQHYIKVIRNMGISKRLFECGFCAKDFKNKYSLTRHMPVHTGVRKYVCDICQKAFRQKTTLIQHVSTHGNKIRHECTLCTKTFVRLSTLAAHQRTHTDEKLFKCHYCSRAFHQRVNLRHHIYIHTGERPFRCDQCGRGFNQKSNLNAHKKKVHSAERRAHSTQTATTEIPNPTSLPSTQNILYKQEINQEINPLLADTILTVVKSPPCPVMEKALKGEKLFALYVENDISMIRIIVRVVYVENGECALVRLNLRDCPIDGLVDVVWIVLRENGHLFTLSMTKDRKDRDRKELKFCDDLKGMNIYKYLKSRSHQVDESNGQTVNHEENCESFDFPNAEFDASQYREGVFKEERSSDVFLNTSDEAYTDDSDKLVILEDVNDEEKFDASVTEEVVIQETVLEEYIYDSNLFCSDDTPLVWHPNPQMLDDGGDQIAKDDIDNRENID